MSPAKGIDQAEGLRKMLQQRESRRLAFVSAVSRDYKDALLFNLAIAGQHLGFESLLLDASHNPDGLADMLGCHPKQALFDQEGQASNTDVYSHSPGLSVARLSANTINPLLAEEPNAQTIGHRLTELADRYPLLLIDLNMENDSILSLPAFTLTEIVILCSPQPEYVKQAYLCIKRLYSKQTGRKFKLLIVDATPQQASLLQKNMNHTCISFLGLSLEDFECLPSERAFEICARRGESLFELFPASKASELCRDLAHRLFNPPLSSPDPEVLSEQTQEQGVVDNV